MARMGSAGKARRVLEFLLGLRDDRVLAALSASGFGTADRERGWVLLRALGMTQAVEVETAARHPAAEALDAWQKQWLRIARVSLERSHPQIRDQLFRGLHAREPAISIVTAFLMRFTKLESARDGGSRSAIEKLRSRGLTMERIDEGRRLLAESMRPVQPCRSDPEARRRAIRTAERALWDYYIEWSQLARAVIRDARLLALLGYGSGRASEVEVGEATAEPEPKAKTEPKPETKPEPETPRPSTTPRKSKTRKVDSRARAGVRSPRRR